MTPNVIRTAENMEHEQYTARFENSQFDTPINQTGKISLYFGSEVSKP